MVGSLGSLGSFLGQGGLLEVSLAIASLEVSLAKAALTVSLTKAALKISLAKEALEVCAIFVLSEAVSAIFSSI